MNRSSTLFLNTCPDKRVKLKAAIRGICGLSSQKIKNIEEDRPPRAHSVCYRENWAEQIGVNKTAKNVVRTYH